MQKILHINGFFNYGGSSKLCFDLAKKLYEKNYEQGFLGSVNGPYLKKFNTLGSALYLGANNKNYGFLDYNVNVIKESIDQFKPDIIHVWLPGQENPRYFEQVLTKYKNVKKVITVLCGQKIGFDTELFDHVLFFSKYQKDMNSHIHNPNMKIIRGGIETPIHNPTRYDGQIVLGRISAWCPSKLVHHTIMSANQLSSYKFIIGGEILNRDYFLKCMNTVGNCNISIHLNMDEKEKIREMSHINVWHYPTSNESFCVSVLEAMSMAKVVISYDNCAIGEFNSEGIKLINAFEETEAVLQTNDIKTMKHLGHVNKEIYNEHYTASKYAGRMIKDVYNA